MHIEKNRGAILHVFRCTRQHGASVIRRLLQQGYNVRAAAADVIADVVVHACYRIPNVTVFVCTAMESRDFHSFTNAPKGAILFLSI